LENNDRQFYRMVEWKRLAKALIDLA